MELFEKFGAFFYYKIPCNHLIQHTLSFYKSWFNRMLISQFLYPAALWIPVTISVDHKANEMHRYLILDWLCDNGPES